jgi:catechol 2,3-dioxygenase
MTIRPRGVRSVEIETGDPERVARFYAEVWNLVPVASEQGAIHFRATGDLHHVLTLRLGAGPPAIRRVVLDVADRDQLAWLHGRIAAAGGEIEAPHALDWPGGGRGFGFRDPEGRNFVLACDVDDQPSGLAAEPDRPRKIAHVNLNSGDHARMTRFLVDVLGFELIDETRKLLFFHGDHTDHTCLVVAKASRPTINHIAYEMPDLDAVMRGAGRMRDSGYPIEWGVGRHGPGNNVFAYFAGPDELPIEYTSEVLQVDASYRPGGPDDWTFPPGRADQWGVTAPPSARLARIQDLFGFSDGGWMT